MPTEAQPEGEHNCPWGQPGASCQVLFLARRSGHPGGPSAHGWASTA